MSAREIADAVGTSDATVVRTAKSLGFAGLRQLRDALTESADGADLSTRLRATVAGEPAAHDVLARAVELQLQSLDIMLRSVTAYEFDDATALLDRAHRVWWAGIGPSACIAEYGAFLCRRLGKPSGAFTHAGHDHADELLAVEPGDTVVALAYGNLHRAATVLLSHAARHDARSLLITDVVRNQTAGADLVLVAGRGSPELFATHAPTMVLVEALVLAVAAHHTDAAAASLRTLNDLRRSITGRRVDVDPR
jgi:DNA-binding MurR/RpiR family transcriptional regulator